MDKQTQDLIPLEELTNRKCKWPIGDPGDKNFGFCGNEAHMDDTPYCEFHAKMAYRHDYVSRRQQQKQDRLKLAKLEAATKKAA